MRRSNQFFGASLLGMATFACSFAVLAQGNAETPKLPDHDAVVGRLAMGYLGASQIGVGASSGETVLAPVVGVRYWFDELLGLDVGLGMGMTSGKLKETDFSGDSVTTHSPSMSAFLLHGGLPLSLRQGKHYSFQIVPEINLGLGFGKDKDRDPELKHSGFRFDMGARAGAELHFGFIGVPELSLQGSIGLQLALASTKTTAKVGDQTAKIQRSSMRLGTTVHDNPWNIFTSNVAALYYF
jgi:hypothetical protein